VEDKIKIKIYLGIKFCSETGLNTLIFFHVLPALEHHTYTEDDVEGGIKIKKKENCHFFWAEIGI
jgi:hypothetical protein